MAGPVRRGVNVAALLDAPGLEAAGRCVRQIEVARAAGFDTVRLPVRWSDHTDARRPYTVEPAALELVGGVVDHALGRGLTVVVNVHHFDELQADPDGQRDRFLARWDQLARRYLPISSSWSRVLSSAVAPSRSSLGGSAHSGAAALRTRPGR
ncbi:hypothetical protein E1212_12950 [Jiangella ureilytica]|uniref:Glycoside hydrolase family 5 domain-containing protein n=1 Tax=Jiangella ureilytica TaxID=2530374 RepID=A0A4R4RNM1_9ACTN|nr:hypothetical protein E1212_12950 [Jiangella ureilytica]